VTLPIARAWGKRGVPNPVPTVDGLLAATARTHGLILAIGNDSLDIEWVNPFTAPQS
jgi:predicted nucleic acid-binding protein